MFRQILSVGGWTLVSRVTGFVRDIVMAAAIGAGPIADAFVVAFRLPNHFRAIFGEGAFNSAFVPTYGRLHETAGEAPARLFAGRILSLMLATQVVLLCLAEAFMPGFVRLLAPGLSARPEVFDLAVTLTRITFPYLLTITLVTLLSAILNAHDRFWAAAAAPILLNLTMIGALTLAYAFPTAGHAAAWGVSVSGLLQLVLVWIAALRDRVAPPFRRPRRHPELFSFFRRLGPAVVGSAGVQIAMFADTIIASGLPTGALSALYYAERLYQLPLGVIGIAAGTVLLPTMSRRIAAGDPAGAHAAQNRALTFTLALAAPAAVAFVLIPDLIMSALFQRGAFDAAAAARSGAVLAAYSIGLPAAVIIRSSVASFFARGDTATPLWASLGGYGVNIALKIALISSFGVTGLALATSVGAWTNVGIVWLLAVRRGYAAPSQALGKSLAAVAVASACLAAVLVGVGDPAAWAVPVSAGPANLMRLVVLAAIGGGVYGGVMLVLLRVLGIRIGR